MQIGLTQPTLSTAIPSSEGQEDDKCHNDVEQRIHELDAQVAQQTGDIIGAPGLPNEVVSFEDGTVQAANKNAPPIPVVILLLRPRSHFERFPGPGKLSKATSYRSRAQRRPERPPTNKNTKKTKL